MYKVFKELTSIDEVVKGLPNIPDEYLPNFKLVYNKGITASSDEKVYDGQTLKCEKYEITGGKLNGGDEPVIVYTGSQTTAGQSENTFTVYSVFVPSLSILRAIKLSLLKLSIFDVFSLIILCKTVVIGYTSTSRLSM